MWINSGTSRSINSGVEFIHTRKSPNRREEKFWGDVSSPYSEKCTRLVTNDKASWCSIIHQEHSFWESALRQPRNRSHFWEICPLPGPASFPRHLEGLFHHQPKFQPKDQQCKEAGLVEMCPQNSAADISLGCCFLQVMWLLLFLLATYLLRELLTDLSYPPSPLVLMEWTENGEKKITFAIISNRFWFGSHRHERWWRGG